MSNYSAPKVSVIMPVYNTERYVERAMVSLMEQTLDNVQYIIIDDGSKDNSLSIIKEVVTRYPNRKEHIILISRENRGVAATRAQGLELATGDYVIHLDADDWATINWLEAMYNKAMVDDADVVVCDYSLIYADRIKSIHQRTFNSGEACVKGLIENKICNANWNKLVKLSLIRKQCISYDGGIDMGEDFIFSMKVFFFAKKISFVNCSLYNYNQENESSLTNTYTKKTFDDVQKMVFIAEQFFVKNRVSSEFAKYINYLKLSAKTTIVLNSDDYDGVIYGMGLYPETNRALIFSPRHWRLKFYTVLFYFNLCFLIKMFNGR